MKCRGTDLPLNLTVMVKMLAMVVLLVNHVCHPPRSVAAVYTRAIEFPPLLFQRTIQTVFLISAIAIIFNRSVRLASLVLGSTMLLAVVSSKAYMATTRRSAA